MHTTEPILKIGKVLLDIEGREGKCRIDEGWLVQVQDDVLPKFLDLRTI